MQYLCEIAAGLALDIDGDGNESEILLADARSEVIDGNLLVEAEADFVEQNAEFRPDRIRQFARDETERHAERMSGAEAANDNIERLGKLFAEPADPARARVPEEQISSQQSESERGDDRLWPEI